MAPSSSVHGLAGPVPTATNGDPGRWLTYGAGTPTTGTHEPGSGNRGVEIGHQRPGDPEVSLDSA